MGGHTTSKLITITLACCLGLSCGEDTGGDRDAGADMVPHVKFTYENLITACIGLAACGIERHPRMSDCIDNFHKVLAQSGQRTLFEVLYDCANKGQGDCKVIRPCLGFAVRPMDPKLVCDNTYKAKCVDNAAYNCDLLAGGWEQALPCSKGGLTCAIKDTGSGKKAAICGKGKCNTKTYKASCKDNKHFKCVGGAVEVNDCAEQQLQCRESTSGCEGTGRSTKDLNPICKGNVLTQSKANYLWERDCTKLWGQKICNSTSNECKGKGKECNEDAFFDTCEGDSLVSCMDGYKKKFDCKKLGYLTCIKATTYGAYCKAASVYN